MVAVVVTVGLGFYEVYHRVASGKAHRRRSTTASSDDDRAGAASRGPRAVPGLPARAHDARGGRHRDRRRHDAGRRAAEPARSRSRPDGISASSSLQWRPSPFLSRSRASRPAGWSNAGAGSVTAPQLPDAARAVLQATTRHELAARATARERQVADRAGGGRAGARARARLPRRRGRADRSARDRARDVVHRRHRGAPYRQGLRGGAAVHGAAGRVLRRSSPRSTTSTCSSR